MWTAIDAETNGRVVTEVFAENAGIAGSNPAALKSGLGKLDFFTLIGGILGQAVPVAEVQQVPFAFRTARRRRSGRRRAGRPCARRWRPGASMASRSARSTTACGRPPRAIGHRGAAGLRRPQDPPAGGPDVHRHLPGAGRRTGHDQRQRHLRGAEERQGRRPGEPAGRERRLPAVRGAEAPGHDEPHVVGFNLMANGALWRKLPEDIQATIEPTRPASCAPSATIRAASTPACARRSPSAA